MIREESRKGIGRERVAELELGVVGVKERIVVRRNSKRREMLGCKNSHHREKSGYVQGCVARERRLSGSLIQILCVCLSLGSFGSFWLSAPPKAKPPRGRRSLGPASAEKTELLRALIRSSPWAGASGTTTPLLVREKRSQSVQVSIRLIQSTRTPHQSLWPEKLPCIDVLTANGELTNSHNLTCLPCGWAAEGLSTF
jgi:hypothetical protein